MGIGGRNGRDGRPKVQNRREVIWTSGNGRPTGNIVDGPFMPGVTPWSSAKAAWQYYTYVVLFGHFAKLLGENVLSPIEYWVRCPGEHKYVKPGYWERKIE